MTNSSGLGVSSASRSLSRCSSWLPSAERGSVAKGFKPTYNSLEERLLANTRIAPEETECWIWQGSTTKDGYAKFNYREDGKHKTARVHRVMFELLAKVKLPPGIELDHQCYTRRCIRPGPGHCMPATKQENLANRRGYQSSYIAESVDGF